jgi:hypothetical protein
MKLIFKQHQLPMLEHVNSKTMFQMVNKKPQIFRIKLLHVIFEELCNCNTVYTRAHVAMAVVFSSAIFN